MSVNKAILIGRLGKDPELTHVNNKALCKFSLATSERWTAQDGQKQEATTWHNIVAWGKPGEVMAQYLSKGREVYIEGRIDNRTYDKKDGTKGYTSEVVVQSFSFVGGRNEQTDQPPQTTHVKGDGSPDDEDLPF